MTSKYIQDAGFESIRTYGTFKAKRYRKQDSAFGTLRIQISIPEFCMDVDPKEFNLFFQDL